MREEQEQEETGKEGDRQEGRKISWSLHLLVLMSHFTFAFKQKQKVSPAALLSVPWSSLLVHGVQATGYQQS